VVKIGAADTAEDAGFVELKARLIGFNGNTHWLNINRGAQGVFGVGDILVARDLRVSGSSARGFLASAILSGVRISGLSAETIGLNVFESIVHKTTRTAKVAITVRAVHELLFGERGQVGVLKEDNAFNSTSGREGPARAALTLILDTSDGTGFNPVDGASGVSTNTKIVQSGMAIATAEFGFVSIVHDFEFSGGEVSEFVQFNFPSGVSRVVRLNEIVVGLEDFEFVEKFFRGIGFAIFRHPTDEGLLIVGGRKSNSYQ